MRMRKIFVFAAVVILSVSCQIRSADLLYTTSQEMPNFSQRIMRDHVGLADDCFRVIQAAHMYFESPGQQWIFEKYRFEKNGNTIDVYNNNGYNLYTCVTDGKDFETAGERCDIRGFVFTYCINDSGAYWDVQSKNFQATVVKTSQSDRNMEYIWTGNGMEKGTRTDNEAKYDFQLAFKWMYTEGLFGKWNSGSRIPVGQYHVSVLGDNGTLDWVDAVLNGATVKYSTSRD